MPDIRYFCRWLPGLRRRNWLLAWRVRSLPNQKIFGSYQTHRSGDTLLQKKSNKHVVENISQRSDRVRGFLSFFKSGLVYDVVPISDVYGPTGWDPNIQALVVSKETLNGAVESKLFGMLNAWSHSVSQLRNIERIIIYQRWKSLWSMLSLQPPKTLTTKMPCGWKVLNWAVHIFVNGLWTMRRKVADVFVFSRLPNFSFLTISLLHHPYWPLSLVYVHFQ